MYHYYVRYSIILCGKTVGGGNMEITTKQEISEMSHIEEIEKVVLNEFKKSCNIDADGALIDFYALLKKDPD